MSCVCQHGRLGGVAHLKTLVRGCRAGQGCSFPHPCVLGAHEWRGWRRFMTPALSVRDSQGHETRSTVFQEPRKSYSPARDSLGPVGAERGGQG